MNVRLLENGAGVQIKNLAWMAPLHCALEGAIEALTQLVTEQGIETPAGVGLRQFQSSKRCTYYTPEKSYEIRSGRALARCTR